MGYHQYFKDDQDRIKHENHKRFDQVEDTQGHFLEEESLNHR